MKLSVVMPTYNRVGFLQAAIKSVFNQTWNVGEIELVVVDDASIDGTEEFIKSNRDKNIKYIKNAINKGGARSRNIGADNSTGEYISFIDSDTMWYEKKIEKQMSILMKDPDSIVYCRYKKQHKGRWVLMPDSCKNGMIFENLLYQNFIDTSSVVMRRNSFFSVGGFDNAMPRFQDWELFLRLSHKYQFICVDEPLFDSLTLSNSITANNRARLEALEIIFSKNYIHILKNRILLERFAMKLFNANLVLGDNFEALRIAKEYKLRLSKKIFMLLLGHAFPLIPDSLYERIYHLR